MSKDGDKLLWNILICVVLVAAFWMVFSWIKKRERELREQQEKASRIFANEIEIIREKFKAAKTRRDLLHEELEIDRFVWYWEDHKSRTEITKAEKELYSAYYSRLNSFKQIAKD
jgi:hypothetical protein